MIKVKNLSKKYGSNVALDNVSFTVKSGEIAVFLGPNGAGKTTTMNILTGYLSSTSGTVTIDGFDILEQPTEAKKRLGYLRRCAEGLSRTSPRATASAWASPRRLWAILRC